MRFGYAAGVRGHFKLIAVVLLALWLPATMHCQLEDLNLFELLTCCDHPGVAPHHDNDCNTDECGVVESDRYFIKHNQPLVTAPALVLAIFNTALQADDFAPPVNPSVAPGAAPLRLSKGWQFALRAAPSARAPSFAS
jgi:hypothetical protein